MFRKYWLENNVGQKYYLFDMQNREQKQFAHQFTNLGATVNFTSFRSGDFDFITSRIFDLGQTSFEMIYQNEPNNGLAYQSYAEFMNFISKPPLIMYRQEPHQTDGDIWFRYVEFLSSEKNEIDIEIGTLRCPTSFRNLSFWQTNDLQSLEVVSTLEGGKFYELERPYAYAVDDLSSIKVFNGGVMETPLRVSIEGLTSNPLWGAFQNGERYGVARILETWDSIDVDSNEVNEGITLSLGGAPVPNAQRYQDITVANSNEQYVTFIWLRPGESILSFDLGSSFSGFVRLEWRNRYV